MSDEWVEWVGQCALGVKKIQLFKGGSGVGEAGGKWPLHPLADVNKPAGHSPGGPEWGWRRLWGAASAPSALEIQSLPGSVF